MNAREKLEKDMPWNRTALPSWQGQLQIIWI